MWSIGKEGQILFVEPGQLLKFDEIYPAFAKFAFRYERMRLAKASCNLHLGEVGLASRLDQPSQESLIRLVVTLIVGIHLRMYSQS